MLEDLNCGREEEEEEEETLTSKKNGNVKLELEYLPCHEVQKKAAEEGK